MSVVPREADDPLPCPDAVDIRNYTGQLVSTVCGCGECPPPWIRRHEPATETPAPPPGDPSPGELRWRIAWMAGTAPRPEPKPPARADRELAAVFGTPPALVGRLRASLPSDPDEMQRRIREECPYALPSDGTAGWRVA